MPEKATDAVPTTNKQDEAQSGCLCRPFRWFWNLPPDGKNVIFTGVIAFATIVYTGVSAFLWCVTDTNTKITRHAHEVAYGARVNLVGDSLEDFVLTPGKDSIYQVEIANDGKAHASRAAIAIDNEISKAQERPKYRLGPIPRRQIAIYSGAANHQRHQSVIPAASLVPKNIDGLLSGDLILRVYGIVLYWNEFCLRCLPFCVEMFKPSVDLTRDPRAIRGIPRVCERGPTCSRYGSDYADVMACPQEDISDTIGHYPESDEGGVRSDAGNHP